MKKSFTQNFRKKLWILLGLALLTGGFFTSHGHSAVEPDAFIVEVNPSSFDINQAVDMTVKAVTANGDVVKDYVGDIFIEVNGIVDSNEYEVPGDGLYTFLAQDQGVKTFSKGLRIKKEWSFGIRVSDIANDKIEGEKTVIVGSAHNDAADKNITIISPIADGMERNDVVNILWSASDLPNSPFDIYLNNSIVQNGTTDANGDINAYISGAVEGDNTLQIKISNANNEVIGESDTINFAYNPIQDGVFDSLQVLPNNRVNQGDKATFNLNTSEGVTSAQIQIQQDTYIPMERKSSGLFTKVIMMDKEGTFPINIQLINAGVSKVYTGITNMIIDKNVSIGKIRLFADGVDKSKLNVTWEVIGDASQFKLEYGTEEKNLDKSVIVPTNEIVLENMQIDQKYYFQITPLDATQKAIGPKSAIAQAVIWQSEPCVVKGITISDEIIGDKHYLVRTAVQNVDKYIIYKSDRETSDTSKMEKVGETTDTRFEYPFNKASKKDQYAYYVVEAACTDGTNIRIDNVKKVKVGPVENILLFIVISAFVYFIYKLYKSAEE